MSDDEQMPRPGADPENSRPSAPAPASGARPAGTPHASDSKSGNHVEVEKPRNGDVLNVDVVSQPQPQPRPAAADEPSRLPHPPVVEGPSPEIALAQDASPLPGAHRGGFRRLPTAPVPVTVQSAPAEPGTEDAPAPTPWAGAGPEATGLHRGLAGWALAFAIVGLAVSLFVGWGFPIGIVAVVSAILALRRPLESRSVAVWAIAIGTVSILYSAGWLLYAGWRAGLVG